MRDDYRYIVRAVAFKNSGKGTEWLVIRVSQAQAAGPRHAKQFASFSTESEARILVRELERLRKGASL